MPEHDEGVPGTRDHDHRNADRIDRQRERVLGLTEPNGPIDCGNSGTGIRLLAGLLAGQDFFTVLTGDESIRRRPMGRVVKPLREMGAVVAGRKGGELAPLAITGAGLHGIDYRSAVASAQIKSSLLLAGLFAQGQTHYREPRLSRDHTERMFRFFEFRSDMRLEHWSWTEDPRLGGEGWTSRFLVISRLRRSFLLVPRLCQGPTSPSETSG